MPKQQKWVEVSPEIVDLETSFQKLEINREQLIDVAILMGTDFNPGIDGIGPKRGLKLIQEFGKAEGALEKLGKEIDNLDEEIIRLLKKRMHISKEVGKLKEILDIPVEDKMREKEIIDRLNTYAGKNLSEEQLIRIFTAVFRSSKQVQE